MPHIEKDWRYKQSYSRSTGEVRPHRQRYGTKYLSDPQSPRQLREVSDIRHADMDILIADVPDELTKSVKKKRAMTVKFRGKPKKDIDKKLRKIGYVYSPKEDLYYITFDKFYKIKREDRWYPANLIEKSEIEDLEVLEHKEKTLTKAGRESIEKLGEDHREYAFAIDFEEKLKTQERMMSHRHGKHSAKHLSDDWEIRGHTHPRSNDLRNRFPSSGDIGGFILRSELFPDPNHQQELIVGSDGVLRKISVVDPKKKKEYLKPHSRTSIHFSDSQQALINSVYRDVESDSNRIDRIYRERDGTLDPAFFDAYNDFLKRNYGVSVDTVPRDEYGNYIIEDVVAK